jgi:hypothetical protein
MLTDNQKLWLEALRSGKYKQGHNNLKTSDSYCCLGVACELSKLDTWSTEETYLGHKVLIPIKVARWLKIHPYKIAYLERLNDLDLLSFSKIADHIEANPERFFYTGELP